MSEFIQEVSAPWYRFYWALLLLLSTALAVAALLVIFLPGWAHTGEYFGFDKILLIVAGLQVAYSLSGFWIMSRSSLPFATLVSSMLFSLVLLHGLAQTSPAEGTYLYIGAWIVTVFLNGAFGPPFLFGFVFLSGVYVLLEDDSVNGALMSTPSLVLLSGSIGIAGISFLFWRHRFVNVADQVINKVTGMLRSNQEQSAILIQSIADGVIVINNDGKITLINPAAASMTQWPVSEATSIDAQLVVKVSTEKGVDIPEEEHPFNVVLAKKTRVNQNLQLNGRDGKKMVISLVISPISVGESNTDSHIAGAVAVMRDISAERAEEQQRAEFISTASHEMRTPVAAIEGYLALALNEKVSTIDSRARGFLEKAHSSTQHLGQLFQDLLTSAKAEDGRISNHPSVIEMGSYLQQLVEDLRFSAQKKGLAAEFIVGTGGEAIDATNPNSADATNALKVVKPLYYIYADPDRLREVITNIFDNACKYTEAGKVSIGLTGNNDVVQLYVRDTGAGIPADDIPHLFQKFYRVDNSATRTIGGTGLGLFISRKIIELYQGRVWVESQLGKGSTFFINLPRLTAQRATQLQSQQTANDAKEAAPVTPATAAATPAVPASATPAATPATPAKS